MQSHDSAIITHLTPRKVKTYLALLWFRAVAAHAVLLHCRTVSLSLGRLRFRYNTSNSISLMLRAPCASATLIRTMCLPAGIFASLI
jgi:hypothetical protein